MHFSFRIFFFLLVCAPVFAVAQTFCVRVVAVSDGDTFKGVNSDSLVLRFRLACVDAPEKKQPYGKEAYDFVTEKILGKTITVTVESQDGYGRYVVRVFTADNTDLVRELLLEGLAWHYWQYDQDNSLEELMELARGAGAGLWKDECPVPPWEFRREKKTGVR